MQPEDNKPDADEAKGRDPKPGDPNVGAAEGAEAKVVDMASVDTTIAKSALHPRMEERRFAQVSRRELLKVVPVLALGVFAIPRFQEGAGLQ
jgi:hypothetical protein